MTVYYNEHDRFAAQWLRNLIVAGAIAPGYVDERSIEDIMPDDLTEFTQCHFFAGIGVWSHALRRAGWDDDRPIWTGSCPCQPFSAAGKGGGFDDERHLWPSFHWLIEQCNPAIVIGEQVASKDGLAWLDLVRADMEGSGRIFAAADLCAAGFGAPHIRQRTWWVAARLDDATSPRFNGALDRAESLARDQARLCVLGEGCGPVGLAESEGFGRRPGFCDCEPIRSGKSLNRDDCPICSVADSVGHGPQGRTEPTVPGTRWGFEGDAPGRSGARPLERLEHAHVPDARADVGMLGTDGRNSIGELRPDDNTAVPHGASATHGLADPDGGVGSDRDVQRSGEYGLQPQNPSARDDRGGTGPTNGFWRDADWLLCRDGKWRPVEPRTFPLVNGTPNRMGRLRGYGNAIVAPVAQAFIEVIMECLP